MIDTAIGERDEVSKAAQSAAETYGETYFRQYHTGLGLVAYERNPHWCGWFAIIADEVIRVFVPNSVLDAGCALGILVESFWDRGVRAQGIDISRYAIDNVRPDMRSYCRVGSLTDPIEGTFDLVTCIEVLEHLESADARAAIENICRVTDTVLFSSTPSDFAEPTHINVCPPIAWIEAFAAHGFGPDLLTDASFLTSHAMVFRRGNPCDIATLKTYALIVRYRILCFERLEVIAIERNNANLARHALSEAERSAAAALQSHAATNAALEAARGETQTAREAQRIVEAQQVLAEANLAAQALERAQAQAHAARQAQAHAARQAQALAELQVECLSYQNQLTELQQLQQDLPLSASWRLTWPIRIAASTLRRVFGRGDRSVPKTSSKMKRLGEGFTPTTLSDRRHS